MTRSVYDKTRPPKESSRAWQAWRDYAALPPGRRSLANLIEEYRRRSATEPPPPTRRLDTLKEWSQTFCWQARLTVAQAEAEQARRTELQRLAEAQARENAKLLHSVGCGAIATAAALLGDLLDPTTGLPKRPAQARDIQPLVRAGIDCLAAARGDNPEGGDPNGDLHKVLQEAPQDTRRVVLQGLHALSEWREQTDGRR